MRAGFGPLLQVLDDAAVQHVVVGPVARYAQAEPGAPTVRPPESLDIAPSFDEVNLARLARVLDAFGATLRITGTAGGMRVPLSPALFVDLPVLPLSTRLGDVTVLRHPLDRPEAYAELVDSAIAAWIDGVRVLVVGPVLGPDELSERRPAPGGGADGDDAGSAGGDPAGAAGVVGTTGLAGTTDLAGTTGLAGTAGLAGLAGAAGLAGIAGRTGDVPRVPATPESEEELAQAILEAVDRLTHPVSVRELVLAMSGSRRLPYKQVKNAAEMLTARGELLREKDGSAYRYRSPIDPGDRIARQIAALLRTAPDCDATLQRARGYIASSAS